MIVPPYLVKGDNIYCFCPCSTVPFERVSAFSAVIKAAGFTPVLSTKTIHERAYPHYLSAADEVRVQDFNDAIYDENIKAVWCMRGGYGASRIVDSIDFEFLKHNPKWLIGFSDITLFHSHLFKQFGVCSLHAPMSFYPKNGNSLDIQTSFDILSGGEERNITAEIETYQTKHLGNVKKHLIGGNLSLLVHTIGTNSEPDWEDKILFLEDTDEYLYAIERMLMQLQRRGVFDKIKGLIVGDFTNAKDSTPPFDKTVAAMIAELVMDKKHPVLLNFPAGHGVRNFPLVHGGRYELNINERKATLTLFLNR